MKRIGRNLSPLCWLPSGKLVCYKFGRIIIINDNNIISSYKLFNTAKESFWARIRPIFRLFRLGIRTAMTIDEETILLSIGCVIYEYSFREKALSKGWCCGKGIRPLFFTEVKDIQGFQDGFVFGGYLSNKSKKPVNVYKRIKADEWKVIYTFPEEMINHIHTIVPDYYRNCLWIFTGDFDEASAIWKVTDNFKKVERVVNNNQKYRGCIAYALPEGLLYATDAPFQDNYIYLMNPETFEVKKIFPMHGSCIYGCQWKGKYVFSSTVEGDGRNTSRMEFYFGRKRGAGIKDDYVHMYMGNLQEGFEEIYKEKKDSMPFYTFQFGVFKFPHGINKTDFLFFQPVATKKYDLSLMKLCEI